ncbi:histidine kinase N-terminal 7TM domain-containing protein [Bacillus sp. CGMCC 1.16607]|uniref:histidine kinase N-terminal 7TM domain-containing diguanylate cyclase n=1 Tax=Bacillus sp. CGMCC 1.16607 TaxID=3351842 RepID=UPI00362569F5
MPQELLIYIIAVVIAGLLSLFLCLFALIKLKDAPAANPYIFVTFLSSIFTFTYAFELASTSLVQIKFWLNIEYLALPFIPVFILLMCFEYVGQKLKQWMYYILFVIPCITIFMHSTNDLHHLYYKSMELRNDTPFPIIKLEWGPFFYVHSIFLFLCLMSSIIILLMQLKKSTFRFRMQIFMMVAGLVTPIIANHFYLNDLSPYGIDLGPVSMSISFLFHGAALLSFQMFNVAPIARDTVFESMEDGVIVLNQKGIIVDFNHAIQKVLPMLNQYIIGKKLVNVLNGNMQLAEIINNQQACDYELCRNGEVIHYHIRFSPVLNKNDLYIGQIITFVDVSERVFMQERLQYIASVDGLTQVLNRTTFIKRAELLFDSLITGGGSVSIIMFDIDHFKNVNDTYGHEAGDIVLTHVARMAKETLRDTDFIGRYGGEEFIICLPNIVQQEAYELADSIRRKVSDSCTHINDMQICVTSSFGVSSTRISTENHHQSLRILMREADQALYAAKRKGRNFVEMYEHAFEYTR